MTTSYGDLVLWGLIVAIGFLTYLIRVSFIGLFGYLDEIPSWFERALRYVPAAVLAALVLPSLVTPDAATTGMTLDKLTGGAFAMAVAWRTESVLATVIAGMGGLWLVRFVVFPAL